MVVIRECRVCRLTGGGAAFVLDAASAAFGPRLGRQQRLSHLGRRFTGQEGLERVFFFLAYIEEIQCFFFPMLTCVNFSLEGKKCIVSVMTGLKLFPYRK
jgi:hypothetical protein